MDCFARTFTMVTDGAPVMALVAIASVSKEIYNPDETWMSCHAHALNNVMKNFLYFHCNTTTLDLVVQDIRSKNKIIDEATGRAGPTYYLTGSNYDKSQETELVAITKLEKFVLNPQIKSTK